MSFPFFLIRGAHPNPESQKWTLLLNKINLQEIDENEPLEKLPVVISEHFESVVDVADPNNGALITKPRKKYQDSFMPTEPDGKFLRVNYNFNSQSNVITDKSYFNNHAVLSEGEPLLAVGWDEGVIGGENEQKFNKCLHELPNEKLVYGVIPDNPSIQISHLDFSTGFTIIVAGRPLAFDQHNGVDATLYQKIDDVSINDACSLRMGPNGELKYFVVDGGTTYNHISEIGKLAYRALNFIIARYDPVATPRITLNLNGIDLTDVDDETPTWSSSNIELGGCVSIGNDLDKGAASFSWQKFSLYSKALTDTEMSNIYNNRRTISPAMFGEIAVGGYILLMDTPPTDAFDSTAYDSTAFQTT